MQTPPALPSLSGVLNFRDMGGLRAPTGVEVISLPVTDPAGTGAEIGEMLMSGDNDRIVARFGDGWAIEEARGNTVAQAVEPEKHEAYAAFIDHVLEADGPVLFHCSAGKERAGWAATVLGMALGVDDDLGPSRDGYLADALGVGPDARDQLCARYLVSSTALTDLG